MRILMCLLCILVSHLPPDCQNLLLLHGGLPCEVYVTMSCDLHVMYIPDAGFRLHYLSIFI